MDNIAVVGPVTNGKLSINLPTRTFNDVAHENYEFSFETLYLFQVCIALGAFTAVKSPTNTNKLSPELRRKAGDSG